MDTEANKQRYKHLKMAEQHLVRAEDEAKKAAVAIEKSEGKGDDRVAQNFWPVVATLGNFRVLVESKVRETQTGLLKFDARKVKKSA